MQKLVGKVLVWAKEKGILDAKDLDAQYDKMMEEMDELDEAICDLDEGYTDDKMDAFQKEMGDVLVTMIINCELRGTSLEECLTNTYKKISKRKGEMRNGTFVKEEDL